MLVVVLVLWLGVVNEALLWNLRQAKEETENEAAFAAEGVLLEEEVKKIRVLLMDDAYENYYHSAVTVQYDGKEETYTVESDVFSNGSVCIECDEKGIVITSLHRQQGNPSYQGSIEIQKTDKGLLLINELPVETYLESVVPSEMPASYEEEALKAQAVCARTYAYKQMQKQALAEYGADVDDSVKYQVYGNAVLQESTSKAVRETAGQVIYQGQELIDAYYFSTSAGITSTDEVWGEKEAASYLKSVECLYDSEYNWSHWNVEISWEKILKNARKNWGADAEVFHLQIDKKSQSGAVIGMTVFTNQGNYKLNGEYEVREFLSPEGCEIVGNNGNVYQGGTLLPSAYFDMDVELGEKIEIEGKGYGHGVGMSQNGANAMAAQGFTWIEILDYFYENIEIRTYNER